MKRLGERLKDAREKKKYTQKYVADKLGISNGTVSGYERNYRDPDTEILTQMATLYGVSVDYLLHGELPKKISSQNNEILNTEHLDNKTRSIVNALEKLNEEQLEHVLNTIKLISTDK